MADLNPMSGETLDLTEENIKKLKEIFPQVLNENQIDFDKLRLILGDEIENRPEKYSFTWNGKNDAIKLAQQPSTGTLRPNKEKSKNWNETENLYIEGDNLEVLKQLQKSYAGKIKVIYIDPPYNTGNDFVYNDDYKDNMKSYLNKTKQINEEGYKQSTNTETSGRYHSDWLNMMYPRLKLARNLLSVDGGIFISIDDNEKDNLIKICDEIFGENNFVGTFVVKSTPNARDYGHIGKMHEYILFYAKDIDKLTSNHLEDKSKKFTYSDKNGPFNIHPLYNSNESFHKDNRPNLYYPFYINPDSRDEDGFYDISLKESDLFSIEVYPPKSVKNSVQFVWRWGKELSEKNLSTEIVGYKSNSGDWRIIQKMRGNKKVIRSILEESSFTSRRGTAELENLFNAKIFDFPKPSELIKQIIKVLSDQDSIILDFFSGSATSAQATMELNTEDNGTRKYIMIQLPEKVEVNSTAYKEGYRTIPDIAIERINRAGDKIIQENLGLENKLDIGFKYFKLDKSNIKKWNVDSENLEESLFAMEDNFVEGRTNLDIVYEVLLKQGLDLNTPYEEFIVDDTSVYDVAFGNLYIILGNSISQEVADFIATKQNEYENENPTAVFNDNGFVNDEDKLNTIEILRNNGFNHDQLLSI